jgi:hypothetical protein
MRRQMHVVRLVALLLVPILVSSLSVPVHASTINPAYAKTGAFAFYSGDGGFVAFMSGVSANITYYVTNVYPNNTMEVLVNANLSMGTEVSTAPTIVTENLTDSISNPHILPALPPQDLTGAHIVFQNITCSFAGFSVIQVPAGRFNATEFQGKDTNGTTLDFWFDRSTGLSLQMVEAASYFQLIQTNIATPISTQPAEQAEAPFVIIFVVGWAAAGLLFYSVIKHYTKRGSKQAPSLPAGKV